MRLIVIAFGMVGLLGVGGSVHAQTVGLTYTAPGTPTQTSVFAGPSQTGIQQGNFYNPQTPPETYNPQKPPIDLSPTTAAALANPSGGAGAAPTNVDPVTSMLESADPAQPADTTATGQGWNPNAEAERQAVVRAAEASYYATSPMQQGEVVSIPVFQGFGHRLSALTAEQQVQLAQWEEALLRQGIPAAKMAQEARRLSWEEWEKWAARQWLNPAHR